MKLCFNIFQNERKYLGGLPQRYKLVRNMKQCFNIFKMSGSILEIYLKDCNKWQKFPQFRYLSLKVIGSVNNTFTFLPSCMPGFHLGIFLITRRASLSNSLSPLLRATSKFFTLPFFLTTKVMRVLPSTPALRHFFG